MLYYDMGGLVYADLRFMFRFMCAHAAMHAYVEATLCYDMFCYVELSLGRL